MEEIEVSVIIPCLNEEKTLPACIEKARTTMADACIPGEVIVADNGSTDHSVVVAQEHSARVVHVKRKGYGNALIHGMRASRGHFLIMADADGSYDFGDIPKFIATLKSGFDFVIGSRMHGTIYPGAMPLLNRYLGTPVLTFLINLFFGCRISDVNCGMRALTRRAFDILKLKAGGMEFASEMVIKSALLKLRMTELPTSLFPDSRGRPPHLRPFRDGWRHLRFMLLFAPSWLFLIPGLVLLFSGFIIFCIILFYASEALGIFTMFFAQGLISTGAQIIFLGITARGFSQFKGLMSGNGIVDRFVRSLTIEKGIAAGIAMSGIGIGICIWVAYELVQFISVPGNIGIFNMALTKIGAVGTAFAILGLQIIFSAFYSGLFNVQIAETEFED